jgi:hypothetical protein
MSDLLDQMPRRNALHPMFARFAGVELQPHEVITRLMYRCTQDDLTRSVAVSALVLALAQVAGPAAIKRPPGYLLIDAVRSGDDPIDGVMKNLTGMSDVTPTGAPEDFERNRRWMIKLTNDVMVADQRTAANHEFLAPRIAEFKRCRGESFGGDRAGLYAKCHDPQLGWISDASNHLIVRLDRDEDLVLFRSDLRQANPRLMKPSGYGETLVSAPKVLSVVGSMQAAHWDEPLVAGIMDKPLPLLFLPHCADAPLATPSEFVMRKLSINLENEGRIGSLRAPGLISDSLPAIPWFSTSLARLRQRLVHIPDGYGFFIQRTLRDLTAWCRTLAIWATRKESDPGCTERLFQDLSSLTLHGVLSGVEALGWHGYGYDAGCSREMVVKLLALIRDEGTISRRELLRRLQAIDAEKRDSILGHLETEGLVTLTERWVAAVPAADYFRGIPARTGVKAPTLQSANADLRSSAGGALTSWPGAAGPPGGKA